MSRRSSTCLLLPLVAVALSTGACAHNTFSPPSSTLPIAPAATLGQDRTAISGGGGGVSGIFGPDIHHGYLELTRGIEDRTDLSIRGTRAQVQERSVRGTNRDGFAGRLGLKHNPGTRQRSLAFLGGVGAGRSAQGRFVSADAGFSLSLDNCHFIPTFTARAFVSEPIDPQQVDLSESIDEHEVDTPKRTRGFDAGMGAELPMGGCGVKAPFALRINVGWMGLYDGETKEEMAHGTIGAVLRF